MVDSGDPLWPLSPPPPLSFFLSASQRHAAVHPPAMPSISTAVYIRHVPPTSFQRPLSDKVLVPPLKPTLPSSPRPQHMYLRLWLITHSSLQINPVVHSSSRARSYRSPESRRTQMEPCTAMQPRTNRRWQPSSDIGLSSSRERPIIATTSSHAPTLARSFGQK